MLVIVFEYGYNFELHDSEKQSGRHWVCHAGDRWERKNTRRAESENASVLTKQPKHPTDVGSTVLLVDCIIVNSCGTHRYTMCEFRNNMWSIYYSANKSLPKDRRDSASRT
jgi:hypothetical protein